MPVLKSSLLGAALAAALFTTATAQTDPPATRDFVVVDGDTLWLAPAMEVVGSRVTAALPGVVRSVNVVDQDALAHLPGRSAAELLQTVPGVVVGQRQQYGVQSDLSIRGSSFEQVQVLLDGFDLGDPQTGHHLMDLPVGSGDIQRLEVLPGHGSTLYGSGAFGGTVNVVTRRPALPDSAGFPLVAGGRGALMGGADGTWAGQADADLSLGQRTGIRLSGDRFRTDGYDVPQDDGHLGSGGNDAETWTTTGRFLHQFDDGEADVFAGYASRNFGALDFYAPYASYERTRAFFGAARLSRFISERVTIEPRVFFRRHTDTFILFRDNPDAYTNDHVTRKAGAELRGLVNLGSGYALSVSADGAYEDIDSRGLRSGVWADALGNHLRRRTSVAAELDGHHRHWRWQLGSRLDHRTGFAGRISGSGALSFAPTDSWTLRASAGSVYRVPTFTELYYLDPSNRGDRHLDAERGWTWDAGAEYYTGPWTGRVTWFERHENVLIEWTRPLPAAGDPVQPWQAMNIGQGKARGAEAGLGWRAPVGHTLSLAYAWLERTGSLPAGLEGKYALLVPRHQVVLTGTIVLSSGLEFTLVGRYLQHTEGPAEFRDIVVVDDRLDWRHPSGWFASLAGTNLLDRRYQEVPGVPMPGTLYTTTLGRTF